MRFISRTFMKGLVVVAPILVAIYVVVWVARDAEAGARGLLLYLLPEELEGYYLPGLGIFVGAGAVFAVGLLMYPWLTRKLIDASDNVLRRIPLFATIYGPVKDLMGLLDGDMTEKLGQVVLIEVPNTNLKTLGFVTRRDLDDLPEGFVKEGHVVVYVQWSSQVGGYCFVVPEDAVTPIDMTVEEGMRWALTAGISSPADRKDDADDNGSTGKPAVPGPPDRPRTRPDAGL